MDLDRIPLWSDRRDITVDALWKAYASSSTCLGLRIFAVLRRSDQRRRVQTDWETETFAYADGHDGNRWVGLVVAQHVDARPGGIRRRPDAASQQIEAEKPKSGGDGEGEKTGRERTGTASRGRRPTAAPSGKLARLVLRQF